MATHCQFVFVVFVCSDDRTSLRYNEECDELGGQFTLRYSGEYVINDYVIANYFNMGVYGDKNGTSE